MAEPKTWAVLTGDIVGSSKLEPTVLKAVMQRLRESAVLFGQVFDGSVRGKLDVYSGDGWQLLVPDWRRSLRAGLYLRAVLKSEEMFKTDTRVAIAWGPVDEADVNPARISESTGPAFTRSGRALAEMKRHDRLALDIGSTDWPGKLLGTSVKLIDELASGWTPRQAIVLAAALIDESQGDIAERLGVSQPTVNRLLRRAGWQGMDRFLICLENSPWGL